jgi:hypothetical protein
MKDPLYNMKREMKGHQKVYIPKHYNLLQNITNYNGENMVQAVITLGEHQDRVLTIVKGKFGLKNKSEAINLVIEKYEEELLEPELRPEFIEEMKKIEKEPTVKVKDFKKHFNLK